MSHEAFFHDDTAAVRFWVEIDGHPVGATIGKATLHYRFAAQKTDDEPLATYRANSVEIDAAVRRRVAKGSIEPVMLREFDVRAEGALR